MSLHEERSSVEVREVRFERFSRGLGGSEEVWEWFDKSLG